MTPTTARLGAAIPVLAVLALAAWGYMLLSFSWWVGRNSPPQHSEGRLSIQLNSGGAAVVVWLLLAAILLLAGTKGLMPPKIAWIACLVHPLSLFGTAAAIALMSQPELRWPLVVPVCAPLFIGGYVAFLSVPRFQLISATGAGLAAWAVVAALSLTLVPEGLRFAEANHLYFSDARREKAFVDSEESWRLQYLKDIKKATRVEDIEPFTRQGSKVLNEANEALRQLPNKQKSVIDALRFGHDFVVRVLPVMELDPTSELCDASVFWLKDRLKGIRNSGNLAYGVLEDELPWIEWMSAHCDVRKELADLERLAKVDAESPERQRLLERLAALHKP